jgi:DNA-binding transcriptional ArsR family regulator
MKVYTSQLDRVFAALSDPTRRGIISRLQEKEYPVMELAEEFDVSFQAISKHLKVLDKAALIERRKEGRFQYCKYNADAMSEAIRWMSFHHEFWKGSFNSLENFLDQMDDKEEE